MLAILLATTSKISYFQQQANVVYIVSLAVRLYATFYIYSVSFGLFLFLKDERDERDERDESEVGYRCCQFCVVIIGIVRGFVLVSMVSS